MQEVFANVVEFILSVLCLTVLGAIIAVILYSLIKGQLGKTNALTVSSGGNPQPGIPFYIKKGRILHETTHLETLAVCTLTAAKKTLNEQKEVTATEVIYLGVRTVSEGPGIAEKLNHLSADLVAAQKALLPIDQMAQWEAARQKFEELPAYTGQIPAYPLPVEGNLLKDSPYVDYETPFYLNKLQPLSGSSEINIELGTDGTLSKTSAKSEDSTLEKVLGVLPLDKLTAKEQPAAEPEKKGAAAANLRETLPRAAAVVYEFGLSVERQYVRHILFKEYPGGERAYKPAIPLTDAASWYRREIVTSLAPKTEAPAAPAEPEKKDEEKK